MHLDFASACRTASGKNERTTRGDIILAGLGGAVERLVGDFDFVFVLAAANEKHFDVRLICGDFVIIKFKTDIGALHLLCRGADDQDEQQSNPSNQTHKLSLHKSARPAE